MYNAGCGVHVYEVFKDDFVHEFMLAFKLRLFRNKVFEWELVLCSF